MITPSTRIHEDVNIMSLVIYLLSISLREASNVNTKILVIKMEIHHYNCTETALLLVMLGSFIQVHHQYHLLVVT